MSDLAAFAMHAIQALPSADAAADAAVAATTEAARMTANGLVAIGKGAAYGASAGGAGIGIGLVVNATISSITRQPEQKGGLMALMFIGIAFIEVFGLLGFAYLFIMK
jgi:F-type H+-transporting ATPase subunit c